MPSMNATLHLFIAGARLHEIGIRHLPEQNFGHSIDVWIARVFTVDDKQILFMQVAIEIAFLERSDGEICVLENGK